MCIIIGYQGVGKSTLAGKDKFIDLESSNFRISGVRPDDWYVIYCNIAIDLSKQGYKVFTSSHREIRNVFSTFMGTDVKIYTLTPDIALKDLWINKLKDRYLSTGLDKDFRAWKNSEDKYEENIKDILSYPFENIVIESMDYDLEDMLYNIDEKEVNCEI